MDIVTCTNLKPWGENRCYTQKQIAEYVGVIARLMQITSQVTELLRFQSWKVWQNYSVLICLCSLLMMKILLGVCFCVHFELINFGSNI